MNWALQYRKCPIMHNMLFRIGVIFVRIGSMCADLITPMIYGWSGSLFYCFGMGALMSCIGLVCVVAVNGIDRHNETNVKRQKRFLKQQSSVFSMN